MTDLGPSGRPFWKQAMSALITDLLIFLLLVGGGELFLRFFVPSARKFIYTKDLTGGHPLVLNSAGLRDDEIDQNFPENGIRIIILGNSVTFGTGIAVEDTFASQLESWLKHRGDGIKYDVINAGGQGNSMEMSLKFLDQHELEYHPDAVVVALTSGYVALQKMQTQVPQLQGSKKLIYTLTHIPFQLHLALYAHTYTYIAFDTLVRQLLFTIGLSRENLNKTEDYLFGYAMDVPSIRLSEVEASYGEISREFGLLKQRLDSQGIPLLIVAIPTQFELSDLRQDNHRNVPKDKIRIIPGKRFQEIAEEQGITFINLLPDLREKRQGMIAGKIAYDPLYISFDTIHLNPTGHRLVAEKLEQMLGANGIIPPLK